MTGSHTGALDTMIIMLAKAAYQDLLWILHHPAESFATVCVVTAFTVLIGKNFRSTKTNQQRREP